jgi:hypothetical protein
MQQPDTVFCAWWAWGAPVCSCLLQPRYVASRPTPAPNTRPCALTLCPLLLPPPPCPSPLPSPCQAGLLEKMRARAESRQLSDLTIGPVLTWTTEAMLDHMNKLLKVPGGPAVQAPSDLLH